MKSRIVFVIFFLVTSSSIFAQLPNSLINTNLNDCNCDSKKLEKSVKKIIKKNNIPDRTLGYSNYNENLDKIVSEISKIDCVQETIWDKCATKIAIYRSTSTIGVKFFSNDELIEKCFSVSEDKMVYFHFFNFRFFIKYKYKLVYKKMNVCNGFFVREKENCENNK